jgi:hypothetical protein
MPRSLRELTLLGDDITEKGYRKHQNRRKRKAYRDYERSSWKLLTRGMPDFLATQIFTRPRAVWVPSKTGSLSVEQKRCLGILKSQGFDVRTVNLEASNYCAPEGSKEG